MIWLSDITLIWWMLTERTFEFYPSQSRNKAFQQYHIAPKTTRQSLLHIYVRSYRLVLMQCNEFDRAKSWARLISIGWYNSEPSGCICLMGNLVGKAVRSSSCSVPVRRSLNQKETPHISRSLISGLCICRDSFRQSLNNILVQNQALLPSENTSWLIILAYFRGVKYKV